MMWKDSSSHYGLISIFLHWFMAALIIGLFSLGIYMTDLSYYDAWYNKAPDIHRSIGVLVGMLLMIRLFWRQINIHPRPLGASWEKSLSRLAHYLFYILLLVIVISGYLISTADGQPVFVFDWFQLPATVTGLENQADKAGVVHEYSAYLTILLALFHALASLKHHYINMDSTLVRMFGIKTRSEKQPPIHNRRIIDD